MALVRFNKVTTLPGTLAADTFYFVENGSYAESYITDSTGVARSVGNSAMISAIVQAALAEQAASANQLEIVADITARDALTVTLDYSAMVLVIDASADATVDTGSALYAWDYTGTTNYKIAEYESLDVVAQWSSINGRPTSTAAQLDAAVSQAHSHSNKAVLDKIGEGAEGLLFDGAPVSSAWTTANW